MESEIETLMQNAAIESQQRAMDAAIKEKEASKEQWQILNGLWATFFFSLKIENEGHRLTMAFIH